jgi:hypothetical protein
VKGTHGEFGDTASVLRTCRAQHETIRGIVSKLSSGDATDDSVVLAEIDRLHAILGAHLRLEDEVLYPLLQASGNAILRNKAARYKQHMGSIAATFEDLYRRWSAKGAIAAEPARFQDGWSALETSLNLRMDSEDEDLYAIAELVLAAATRNPEKSDGVFATMNDVRELQRHAAPGGRPQPLAMHQGALWNGCWDTRELYAIQIQPWSVGESVAAPGTPYGIASFGGELRVVVSLGDDDDRYLYRFVPGSGFDEASKTPCPDFTGSHLASDGTTLYLGQMGNRRILALDGNLQIQREIALPTRCGGFAFGPGGTLYMISADEEFENLQLATLDVSLDDPQAVAVATIPFDARGLAFDGKVWWTCHREANEIVSFTV